MPRCATLLIIALSYTLLVRHTEARQDFPTSFELDQSVVDAMNAEWFSENERRTMRVFHGVWDPEDLDTPVRRALASLQRWSLDDEVFDDPHVPLSWRANALLQRGELAGALTLLEGQTTVQALRRRAAALEGLGRYDEALVAADEAIAAGRASEESAEVVTETVRAMIIRARLQGQPSQDFQAMLDELARVRTEIDRLYWPSRLVEAELLTEKHKSREALMALVEVLRLNPRCSTAWWLIGRLMLERVDFATCERIMTSLRDINATHPLATLLEAEYLLVRDDPTTALDMLTQLIDRMPRFREAYALRAAALALLYDEPAMRAALDEYDDLSPGSAIAYATVGRFLSLYRQYDLASDILGEAIRRQPKWPKPQIERGLMELQAGRDAVALDVLQAVAELDRFNTRAANSLFLLEELADYHTIETEHFIIRYKPGVDEVLVRTMPEELERIHDLVTSELQFEPSRRTTIEVLPDHERFAVRITGMPWIHTVAACTGPVIAMEVPREGRPSEHFGPFDWRRVLQHEYTHTVTLAQTGNRIPHWFTEAIAVRMEESPRSWNYCVILAEALRNGTLFSLEDIKWAFVRPKQPNDRTKAYAQGDWMVEFMTERYGQSAMLRLLEAYFDGQREVDAMPSALGVTRAEFYQEFLAWAEKEVDEWGMDPEPPMETLLDEVRENDPVLSRAMHRSRQARLDAIVRRMTDQIGQPGERSRDELTAANWPELAKPPVEITDERLDRWRDAHPGHPDLLTFEIRRRIDRRDGVIDPGDVVLLERLIELRPVDPFPHRRLAKYWLDNGDADRAIPHLEELRAREQYSPVFAIELASAYRELEAYETALDRATHALHIDPYDAATRELAAAIAIQAGRLDLARLHIEALTLLEPDRPRHAKRLRRINELIGAQSTR